MPQGSLTVKSAAFDSNLGGRDIDWAIAQHCADEFQAKTGKVCLRWRGLAWLGLAWLGLACVCVCFPCVFSLLALFYLLQLLLQLQCVAAYFVLGLVSLIFLFCLLLAALSADFSRIPYAAILLTSPSYPSPAPPRPPRPNLTLTKNVGPANEAQGSAEASRRRRASEEAAVARGSKRCAHEHRVPLGRRESSRWLTQWCWWGW